MKYSKCERCGKICRNYGMVTVTENDEFGRSETICSDCYNKAMSVALEVEDFKDFEPHIIIKDSDDIEHEFEIRKMIQETGIFWEAVEFLDNYEIGYSFDIYQSFEDDSLEAVAKLKEKVEKGLSKKYIKRNISNGYESLTLSEDVLEGKIEWDDNYDGRIPKFKIDGKAYSAEQIGKILMGYEGWDFELRIKEPTD